MFCQVIVDIVHENVAKPFTYLDTLGIARSLLPKLSNYRLDTIAKELNISQGLCYRYFPTKEAIYDAALEKYADMIAEENQHWVDTDIPIRTLIDGITDRMDRWTSAEKKDLTLYALFHEQKNHRMHDELFLRVAKKVIPCVQDHLRCAKERGEISIDDPDGAAIVGIYGFVGLCLTRELTDEERMKKMRETWYQLLGL